MRVTDSFSPRRPGPDRAHLGAGRRRWSGALATAVAAVTALGLVLHPTPAVSAQEAPPEVPAAPTLDAPEPGPDTDAPPDSEQKAVELPDPTPAGTFTPGDCLTALPAGAGPDDVRCGYVSVPLDHADPTGETIQLAVAVRRATGPEPAADPLLVLGGGPGEHLVSALPALVGDGTLLAAANVERDVILLDQRGVGLSRPALVCPPILDPSDTSMEAYRAGVLACQERLLAAGIDLSAFDTEANVHDLDVVRRALGYDTWNVFGTSYGARLALQAGRAYPDTIRSQVLSSPVPAERNFIAEVGPSFDAALARLGEACAADAACTEAVGGDLVATLDEILAGLAARPATTDVTDPTSGQVVTMAVTDDLVATILFQLSYSGAAVAVIPALVAEMASGDHRNTVEALYGRVPVGELAFSQGMQLSFLCAEEVAQTSRDEVAAAAEGLSRAPQVLVEGHPILGVPLFDLCQQWGVEPADPITFTPVETGPPTLVVTGAYDQITPPSYGAEVHASLPVSHLVEVPDQAHSPLLPLLATECGNQVLGGFLADPVSGPDASCVEARSLELVPALPVTPRLRATSDACPPGLVPPVPVPDVEETSVHLPHVQCLLWWQIVPVDADGAYRPDEPVTRGQVASTVARLLVQAGGALPAGAPDAFVDDEGSAHEPAIDQLAALGVVQGRGDGTFGADEPVSRAELASMVAGVVTLLLGDDGPAPLTDAFTDDDGSIHEPAIDLLAGAEIVAGHLDPEVGGFRYRPDDPVPGDELASLLARTLDLLRERGLAPALPAPPVASSEDPAVQ